MKKCAETVNEFLRRGGIIIILTAEKAKKTAENPIFPKGEYIIGYPTGCLVVPIREVS